MQANLIRRKNEALKHEIKTRTGLCKSILYEEQAQRLVIPYYNLNGNSYKTEKGIDFVRFRNYSQNSAKYTSPSKKIAGEYQTPLYYPSILRSQFQNDTLKGNTIVITEGEFKAITAVNNGINCISFAGISIYNHIREHLQEFTQFVNKIKGKTVNIVILYDADATNPYTKHEFTSERLANFNSSAKLFFEVLSSIETKKKMSFYVGHIDHEEKGLDDLLNSVEKIERSKIASELNAPKFCKSYFNLKGISKRTYKDTINDLFPSNKLQSFLDRYKNVLIGQNFVFRHERSTGARYHVAYHLDKNGILTAKSNFYKNLKSTFDESHIFKNYASDCFKSVRKALKEKKRVLLQAQTGAGKTQLTKSFEKDYHRIILLEPTRAIAKQQTEFLLNIGGVQHSIGHSIESIVSTFSKLAHDGELTELDFANGLLVVDEAHELYKSFGYRAKECSIIEHLLRNLFTNVLATTATPLVPFFKALDFHCVELKKEKQVLKKASVKIVNTRPNKNGVLDYSKIITGCIQNSRSNDRKAYIYHISKNNHIIEQVHHQDKNTMLITADTSRFLHKETFEKMLREKRAFVGDYDVLLTNSVLETGASFLDENVDVYILFRSDHSEIVQACARFRDLETINYQFYLKQQNWVGHEYEPPKNNLKELELESLKEIYEPDSDGTDIHTTLSSITKTYNDKFSYSKSFHEFEKARLNAQSSPMLLGKLKQLFDISQCEEIEPPRKNDKDREDKIKVNPTQIMSKGKVDESLVASIIKSLGNDKRRTQPLSLLENGFEYFQNIEAKEIKLHAPTNAYQLTRLVVYSYDLAEKFNIDVKKVLTVAQKLIDHLGSPTPKNRFIIENRILFELLKMKPQNLKRIKNKGKRILWANILDVSNKKKSIFSKVSILDFQMNQHLRRYDRRDLYRFLKIVNIGLEISTKEIDLKDVVAKIKSQKELEDESFVREIANTPYKRIRDKKKRQHHVSDLEIIEELAKQKHKDSA